MQVQIIECSPLAKMRLPAEIPQLNDTSVNPREKYPYSGLPIGFSFTLPLSTVDNEHSFRNTVAAKAKKLGRKLTVIKHGQPHYCYEVARIG